MDQAERDARLRAAMKELDDFCGIFGFGLEWTCANLDRPSAGTMLEMVYRSRKMRYVVLRERARRDYRGTGWSPLYSIAERMLNRLRRGATLVWKWEESRRAERGGITVMYMRKYRVPRFAGVSALRLALAAEGSEFA